MIHAGPIARLALLLGFAATVSVASAAEFTSSASLTITRGGTYSGGTYERVIIDTAEPVILENAMLRGGGDLVTSHYKHANVTIRNVRGEGVRAEAAGAGVGRFASISGFDHVVIENCQLDRTAGIYLLDYAGDRSPRQTVRIRFNRARNIDGRRSDGKGGFLADAALVQFVQFDKVRGVSGAAIAWNEVINEPDSSRVEDVISTYLSSGTQESPLRIHDNFIRGAYPVPAADAGYSGGGIMLGDGIAPEGPAGDPAFVHAQDNVVLDTVNYGIAISAGHDCRVDRNRVLSAGVMPDGRPIAGQNVGIYIWDSHQVGRDRFANNTGRDNVIGWAHPRHGRNDAWTPDAAAWETNHPWPDPLTFAAYDQEHQRWQQKAAAKKIHIGPRPLAADPVAAPATPPSPHE